MKKIYYDAGPNSVKAGIGGMFRVGKYKLVPGWIADKLLENPMFKEVGKGEKIELDDQADTTEFAGRENPPSEETPAASDPIAAQAVPAEVKEEVSNA